MFSKLDILKKETSQTMEIWNKSKGFVDDTVFKKIDSAMLNWIVELTDSLSIWCDKGNKMTTGELILARTNLGALVEAWLKFFYCIFYIDYLKKPLIYRNKIEEPNDLSFEKLKNYSVGILFQDRQCDEYKWVEKIQYIRNSIHIFNYRDIKDNNEFFEDLEKYYDFIQNLLEHLPPIEDYL